jgi:hypothetical protein
MIIAFCTSCKNRRWQLENTLPSNLAAIRGSGHFIALCNYNSTDALDDYVARCFADDIREGGLTYFHTASPGLFHASKAKNAAHRLALTRKPDVLFNLDADNFITNDTVPVVVSAFNAHPDAFLHHWSKKWGDGTFGRIAMRCERWLQLGGYDETLREMAWQDLDLLCRARAIGLQYQLRSDGLKDAVPNTMTEKLANVGLKFTGEHAAHVEFRQLHLDNMIRTMSRPIALSIDDHERYAGRLDLKEGMTTI